MSMPRSRRIRARTDLSALLIAALLACGVAQAKQTDKNQPININASGFAGSQDSGKITFTGSVTMDQGTFHADGAKATGYTDPDDTSQWQRVVLTGTPAHFRQTQDNGTLVHGQAATIDYKVSENTVILTGSASVVQQGRGEFHGERLVYNTDSGEIQGTPAAGGRVHITLQPRSKPAPAGTKPASPGTPAPAGSTPPASAISATPASTSAPAPASTTGTH
jgi:lipopolysaccharide export system protein LptA